MLGLFYPTGWRVGKVVVLATERTKFPILIAVKFHTKVKAYLVDINFKNSSSLRQPVLEILLHKYTCLEQETHQQNTEFTPWNGRQTKQNEFSAIQFLVSPKFSSLSPYVF